MLKYIREAVREECGQYLRGLDFRMQGGYDEPIGIQSDSRVSKFIYVV